MNEAREAYRNSKTRPGFQANVWGCIGREEDLVQVVLEALVWVMACSYLNESSFTKRNTIALELGKRSEYVLWLNHPIWGAKRHLKGIRFATGNDLGMGDVMRRLRDKGLRKMEAYKPLTRHERIGLGTLLVELIACSTGLIETGVKLCPPRGKAHCVWFTSRYWEFLGDWRKTSKLMRSINMPMLCPPKPWSGHSDGGFLSIVTPVSRIAGEDFNRLAGKAKPCVLGSLNKLQGMEMEIDWNMAGTLSWAWDGGHEIGEVPRRERMEKPDEQAVFRTGGTSSDYWRLIYRWKADRAKDALRSKVVNVLVALARIERFMDRPLWFVHFMDHRGRAYPRAGNLSFQGSDAFRSLIDFREKSPIIGHEHWFAWSVGDALGLPKDMEMRAHWLHKHSEQMGLTGMRAWEMTNFWTAAKKPWRFLKLCQDWYGYLEDPSGYRTGTPFQMDQTTSGYGHLAALTRDGRLAELACVTGDEFNDIYCAAGIEAQQLMQARMVELTHKLHDLDEKEVKEIRCIDWWMDQDFDRDMMKRCVMPYLYGRGHSSLIDEVWRHLMAKHNNFLDETGLRMYDCAVVMARYVSKAMKEIAPGIGDLARWLRELGREQIAKGYRPQWITPNGLVVECWEQDSQQQTHSLVLSGRKLTVASNSWVEGGKKRPRRGICADFIHSHEAAFLQRVVAGWTKPIATIHDCFATTLEHVYEMELALRNEFAKMYYEDHLARLHAVMERTLEKKLQPPPVIGTLDLNKIGENRWLFT